MDNTKIQKLYTDNGFGFPVQIINAPLKKIRGSWALNLNTEGYAKTVLIALSVKPARLTGNEIKFVRNYFEMTLKKFGNRFGEVAHSAVIKWEKFGDESTSMNWACEKDIRLFIFSELNPKLLVDAYTNLEKIAPIKTSKIKIDSSELLAA